MSLTLPARYWEKVYIPEDNPDGCWTWQAAKMKNGYGIFTNPKGSSLAHVQSFLDFGGRLDERNRLVLHKCNIRNCVNPRHLYAGDHKQNARDALAIGSMWTPMAEANKAKTHCPAGHPLSGDNLCQKSARAGIRRCRTCRNKYALSAYYRRGKEVRRARMKAARNGD